MTERQRRIERILAIEREYRAATEAVSLLEAELGADPNRGDTQGWRNRDARNLARNLESTYLIRLFAEFESGLRSCWERSLKRTTHPPVKDLLDAIAYIRTIPQDLLDDVHEVRRLRNAFVHESDGSEIPLSLAEAKSRLCHYFSWLPLDW